jgi:F-type H+-transporting ATPase subunit b
LLALLQNSIQLVPDGTLILHVIMVVVMVVVLSRTLFKPINRILEERELATRGQLSEAEEITRRVKEMLDQYEEKLRGARTKGYQLLEHRKVNSLKDREQKLLELKNDIRGWLAEQKAELRSQAEQARRTLETESRVLGINIASRILGRRVGEGSNN